MKSINEQFRFTTVKPRVVLSGDASFRSEFTQHRTTGFLKTNDIAQMAGRLFNGRTSPIPGCTRARLEGI